jgi:hypothetical protein
LVAPLPVDAGNGGGEPGVSDGKQIMGGALSWLLKTSGPSGGFLEFHPGTDDRIQRVYNLP